MADYVISPAGVSGNAGTLGSPWDRASALSGHSGAIQPGDTVWMRGGTYSRTDLGDTATLAGSAGLEVIFRAYNPTVFGVSRSQWFSGGRITDVGTGDPTQDEHVIFEEILSSPAPSAGAITVNGINGSGSATVSIAKATNAQVVALGNQLTIATGPAAGVYIINPGTTLNVGNTTVSITPNLRGATAGGEVVTLKLTPASPDLLTIDNGANFVFFMGVHYRQTCPQRTSSFSPAAFSTFSKTNDGVKCLNSWFEGFAGAGVFLERTSGDFEAYGNAFMNGGLAPPGTNDGGGHGCYIHHLDAAKFATIEANCFFNDHGVSTQLYDASGNNISRVRLLRNIAFNSGQRNNDANLGRANATSWVIGASQAGTLAEVDVDGNHAFQTDGNGDRAFDLPPNGQLVGLVRIRNNVSRVSGSGYGALKAGTIGVGGTLVHTGNKYRLWRSDATHNGRAYNLAEAGAVAKPGQYDWGDNVIYRELGVGGNACGDENPGGQPFLSSVSGIGGCRTPAQFLTDCGFPTAGHVGDTRSVDSLLTEVYVIERSKYCAGSAWVVYYNYANLTNIPVDLAGILYPGDTYVVHDVRDCYPDSAPIIGPATYSGLLVNFPNTQVADPAQSGSQIGVGAEVAPPATAPVFNAFLVKRKTMGPRPKKHFAIISSFADIVSAT